MRNLRLFAAALLLAPAAAHAAEPIRIDRQGFELEYLVAQQPDGSRLITGRDLKDGTEFEFRVRGRKVTGDVGGRRVVFTAPRARVDAKPTLIASK